LGTRFSVGACRVRIPDQIGHLIRGNPATAVGSGELRVGTPTVITRDMSKPVRSHNTSFRRWPAWNLRWLTPLLITYPTEKHTTSTTDPNHIMTARQRRDFGQEPANVGQRCLAFARQDDLLLRRKNRRVDPTLFQSDHAQVID